MINYRRCTQCNLFGCFHVQADFALKMQDPMESFSGVSGVFIDKSGDGRPRVRVSDGIVSTIPVSGTPEANKKIVIPPPPKVPALTDSNIISKPKDLLWATCNLCDARVHVKYLDGHLKVHTQEYEPKSSPIYLPASGSTTTYHPSSSSSTTSGSTTYQYQSNKPEVPRVKSIETYRFRNLDAACAASSTTTDGRYSDFTVIFWDKEKTVASSSVYAGGSSSTTYKDWERLNLHIIYDSKEDYYVVNCKLLKRSSYSTFDTEETVPDRICTQKELMREIKRALLFFRVSPRGAYKHFRKLFRQDLVVDYDAQNRAAIVQTKNCADLDARLKKEPVANKNYGHYGWAMMEGYD